MIKLIYGATGTGKTKIAVESANKEAKNSNGLVVFVTDTNSVMFDLDIAVRLVNTNDYKVEGVGGLRGFLKGIVAANSDNHTIYVDGISRITDQPIAELEPFFTAIEELGKDHDITFVVTCSTTKDDMPEYLKKYL